TEVPSQKSNRTPEESPASRRIRGPSAAAASMATRLLPRARSLQGQFPGLRHEHLDDLGFRDAAPLHLPLDDELAVALAGGDAEVCLAGLAGAVHHAPHHRHSDRRLQAALFEGL